jgi:hypoxanthine phosphoribosyltransferase
MTMSDIELPEGARLVYTAAEIGGVIERMAAEITADLAGRNPIVIPILMGGVFTAVGLTAHFRFPYEMDSVRLARYGPAMAGGELHWYQRPCLDLDGRHLLLVDDVLDRGVTLHAVETELKRMNAASVSLAVLIRKHVGEGVERPAVDYVGADAPDVFLFGCGMDLEGRWRGLPSLYALTTL